MRLKEIKKGIYHGGHLSVMYGGEFVLFVR